MIFDACSIIARNYLPFARVLARSYRRHHPGRGLAVLVIDDRDMAVDDEPFLVVRLEDLAEDSDELRRMAAIYDVVELATALKPWALEFLLGRGAPSALYLDPDMFVLGPLDDVFEAAGESGVLLTPHVTAPIPRDGRLVEESSILGAGTFNLGFIGVGPSSGDFLAQWKLRLARDCIVDPTEMLFVDQRWVDLVPGAFECAILRDPGVNVAYWNLHERPVRQVADGWQAGGAPLRLFHFSGYSPLAPYLLSKHQGDRPRILLSEEPDLARLCEHYGAELLEAGLGRGDPPPYGWGTAANGLPLDRTTRRLWRGRLLAAERGTAEAPPDPFDVAGAGELVAMLNAPPGGLLDPGHLPSYLAAWYQDHPELERVFPDPQGEDRARYLEWAAGEAGAGRIDGRLVPDAGTDLGERWAPPDRLRPGVLVAGYLQAELGVGEGARLMTRCLDAADVPYATWSWSATLSRQQHPFVDARPVRRDCDVNLIAVNADQLPHFAARVGPGFFAGRYTVGQWAWELEEFPRAFESSFTLVSEVWAVSEFARAAIAARADRPVFAVPHAVVAPPTAPSVGRAELGLPEDRSVFLFAFDLASVLARKNPEGLLDAFRRAFAPDEGPVLVLKVINAEHHLDDLERLRFLTADQPDVRLWWDYLDAARMGALMAAADCYVSLHRSEGFGLTMAEAMALGKPVIATGYSGNLDFMDERTALLVPWRPGAVPAGSEPYPAGARWAEPDLDEAATLLRWVAERPVEAVALGARARRHVEQHHSPEARAPFLAARFAAIQELRAGAPVATGGSRRRVGEVPGGVVRRVRRAAAVLRDGP